MIEILRLLKRKRIIRQIKKSIQVETNEIAMNNNIKKNSGRYKQLLQDVIDGKPQIMGEFYKVPQ